MYTVCYAIDVQLIHIKINQSTFCWLSVSVYLAKIHQFVGTTRKSVQISNGKKKKCLCNYILSYSLVKIQRKCVICIVWEGDCECHIHRCLLILKISTYIAQHFRKAQDYKAGLGSV